MLTIEKRMIIRNIQFIIKGEVRDLTAQIEKHKLDTLPENAVSVALLQKMVKKMSVRYDPDMFSNPKLEKQRLLIEEIALDQELTTAPIDSTRKKIFLRFAINNT